MSTTTNDTANTTAADRATAGGDIPGPRRGGTPPVVATTGTPPDTTAGNADGADQPMIIEDVTGARFVLVPEARYRALHAAARSTTTPRPPAVSLTTREQQVLQMIADGSPGSVVADRLGLAPNTVAQHLVAARRKYGVRSSAAAATLARQQGLLD